MKDGFAHPTDPRGNLCRKRLRQVADDLISDAIDKDDPAIESAKCIEKPGRGKTDQRPGVGNDDRLAIGESSHRLTSQVVVPSLLSWSTTPMAASSPRMRSLSFQFFAFLASRRATTNFSISDSCGAANPDRSCFCIQSGS